MKTIRSVFIAGAALLAASVTGAGAADLGGSIKDGYAPMASSNPARWYFRADVGHGWTDEPRMSEDGLLELTRTRWESTWSAGAGIGYYFSPNVRGDLTWTHRFDSEMRGYGGAGAALQGMRRFDIGSDIYLANLYYDFNRGGRITPYLGVGLGVVRHRTGKGTIDVEGTCGCGTTVTADIEGASNWHVAGAFMAGFSMDLWRHGGYGGAYAHGGSIKDAPVHVGTERTLKLDVGYRFLYLGETHTGVTNVTYTDDTGGVTYGIEGDPQVRELHVHEFRVGLRYDFR